ncbi:hypothetical protein C1H46_004018 [Malus baccata]|uniref:Uncharacterized protein n=1 Tax=Malus baccata TaxID=106549 RepID=A0A540NHA0_MALBA|nr:hypothetical protein C1H46_004018 [Malus baccata]
MVSSSKTSKSPKISPYNLLLTTVYNRKEGKTSFKDRLNLLSAFRHITYLELLNHWYGAVLGIQEFKVLHNIRKSFDNHCYFTARPSLIWESCILDVLWQNRDWFKDIMVVDGDWERGIEGITVRAILFPNPQFNNELEDIKTCQLKLINWAMHILAEHINWKWLLSPSLFTDCGKDLVSFLGVHPQPSLIIALNISIVFDNTFFVSQFRYLNDHQFD